MQLDATDFPAEMVDDAEAKRKKERKKERRAAAKAMEAEVVSLPIDHFIPGEGELSPDEEMRAAEELVRRRECDTPGERGHVPDDELSAGEGSDRRRQSEATSGVHIPEADDWEMGDAHEQHSRTSPDDSADDELSADEGSVRRRQSEATSDFNLPEADNCEMDDAPDGSVEGDFAMLDLQSKGDVAQLLIDDASENEASSMVGGMVADSGDNMASAPQTRRALGSPEAAKSYKRRRVSNGLDASSSIQVAPYGKKNSHLESKPPSQAHVDSVSRRASLTTALNPAVTPRQIASLPRSTSTKLPTPSSMGRQTAPAQAPGSSADRLSVVSTPSSAGASPLTMLTR
ncbi:hypothetical protein H0H81_005559, partial [Sphagnurus paluster]